MGINNDRGRFKPGTFAEVKLTIESASRAVVVPARAVTFADGEPVVFVPDGGRVRRRPVRLGIVNRDPDPSRDQVEVLAGLSPGQQVVVGDATAILADGMAIRPKENGPPPPRRPEEADGGNAEKMAAASGSEVPR